MRVKNRNCRRSILGFKDKSSHIEMHLIAGCLIKSHRNRSGTTRAVEDLRVSAEEEEQRYSLSYF